MKIKDLKQPYRALAEMRREQQINSELFRKEVQYTKGFEKDSLLKNAFCWNVAREGSFWWYDLDNGKLPGIPAESLAELKEWQNKKQFFDCKGDIDKEGQCFCNKDYEATVIAEQPKEEPNDKLFQAAVAAMQGLLSTNLFLVNEAERIAQMSWEQAEALINEGKKRGHL